MLSWVKFLHHKGQHMRFSRFLLLLILFSSSQVYGDGFSLDTYVKIFSNSIEGWQSIDQIYNHKTGCILAKSYDSDKEPFFKTIKFTGKSKTNCYFKIVFGSGVHSVIRCTPSQAFYSIQTGKWVSACELCPGDKLFCDGVDNTVQITDIKFVREPLEVYTLEVDDTHTFLVGFNSVLTHNIALTFSLSAAFGSGAISGGKLGSYFGPVTAGIGLGVGGLVGIGISYYRYSKKNKLKYDLNFDVNKVQQIFNDNLEKQKSKKHHSGGGGPSIGGEDPENNKKKKRGFPPKLSEKKKDESTSHPNGKYHDAPYHKTRQSGRKSPRPKDGQVALDNSLYYSEDSPNRVGISEEEFVVLSRTRSSFYHGHVRTWKELTPNMKRALIKNKLVSVKGKII